MKKKLLITILVTVLCMSCLAGCNSATNDVKSPIIVNKETEESAENNDVIKDDTEVEETVSDNAEIEETISENEETTVSDNTVESTEETTTETEEVDPYSGLAVANCHSVTLTKGISYNDAINEVVKGTSAYPDTFPNIYNVDFNTPGVYNCYWERKQEDGTYLPLDYATFTVTIVE